MTLTNDRLILALLVSYHLKVRMRGDDPRCCWVINVFRTLHWTVDRHDNRALHLGKQIQYTSTFNDQTKNQPENKIQIQENGQNMPEDRTRYKPVNRLTRPDKWRYPTHKCPKQNPSPIGWKKEQCELKMTPVMCEIF